MPKSMATRQGGFTHLCLVGGLSSVAFCCIGLSRPLSVRDPFIALAQFVAAVSTIVGDRNGKRLRESTAVRGCRAVLLLAIHGSRLLRVAGDSAALELQVGRSRLRSLQRLRVSHLAQQLSLTHPRARLLAQWLGLRPSLPKLAA